MVTLVEIQASHVGIGKTTFVKRLGFPYVDDCVALIETFSTEWYEPKDPLNLSKTTKNLLVLEHYLSKVEQLIEANGSSCIVTSRSPLVSCFQFDRSVDAHDLESYAYYCEKRLKRMGVERVLILDYGTDISSSKEWTWTGYRRMVARGRDFELARYPDAEVYATYFEEAESRKEDLIQVLTSKPWIEYRRMAFNGFNDKDVEAVETLVKRDEQ